MVTRGRPRASIAERFSLAPPAVGADAHVGLALLAYGAASLLTGAITRSELELMPGVGSKLAEVLARLKLIWS